MKLCEIVQQEKYINIDIVKGALENKKCIKDWLYILHDKDIDDSGNNKEPHYHIYCRLNNSYDSKYIAQWFNVPEQYVGKIKGKWSDALNYATHRNKPDKFQYDDSEVFSNFDWQEERNSPKSSKQDYRREEIINFIVGGIIREFNYTDYISPIEFDKYKRSIDNAFKYRVDKIKGAEREMDVIFMTGDSGTGKTTYAKEIAKQRGFSVYVSSGSNDVLDDYKGQDCLILDDLRPSCMGLSDLLKMLDNHTTSTVKSRYKNKILECKLIIITTVMNIDKFFNNVFTEEKEPAVQLKRRCKLHIRFTRTHLYQSVWNDIKRCYGVEYEFPNPVAELYAPKEMTVDEELSYIQGVLGTSASLIKEIRENVVDEDMQIVHDDDNPF